jgi:periplasmic copper chaperone A
MNRSSVSLPRSLARLATVLLAVLAVLATSVGIAAAHISVSSADAAAGGFGKVTFRVPNESDTASTVAVRIQIPEEAAMASLRTAPVPGWTVTTTTSGLAEPLEAHGQEIREYVSVVEFRAEDGGGIAPGQFQEFALSGGPLPELDRITFPTVQTYSDGSESAWIEPTIDGQAEPEFPAPVLTVAGGEESEGTATVADPAAEQGHGAAVTSGPAALALFLAILALLVGASGAILGWRAYRRTVGS